MVEGIVDFDEWQKLDLRVGKIIEIEDIEGADKLYKLSIDLGSELTPEQPRILVAGLKPFYSKEELKDRLCIVFTNLQPRKMKGIQSEGMILAAVSPDESQVSLIQPEKDIEKGAKIR